MELKKARNTVLNMGLCPCLQASRNQLNAEPNSPKAETELISNKRTARTLMVIVIDRCKLTGMLYWSRRRTTNRNRNQIRSSWWSSSRKKAVVLCCVLVVGRWVMETRLVVAARSFTEYHGCDLVLLLFAKQFCLVMDAWWLFDVMCLRACCCRGFCVDGERRLTSVVSSVPLCVENEQTMEMIQ